jgi:hypothetical protein
VLIPIAAEALRKAVRNLPFGADMPRICRRLKLLPCGIEVTRLRQLKPAPEEPLRIVRWPYGS